MDSVLTYSGYIHPIPSLQRQCSVEPRFFSPQTPQRRVGTGGKLLSVKVILSKCWLQAKGKRLFCGLSFCISLVCEFVLRCRFHHLAGKLCSFLPKRWRRGRCLWPVQVGGLEHIQFWCLRCLRKGICNFPALIYAAVHGPFTFSSFRLFCLSVIPILNFQIYFQQKKAQF